MKKYLRISLIPLISIIFFTLLFSLINIFNIEIHPIIYILIMILTMFIYGYLISNVSLEKGYLKALLLGSGYVLLMFLLSLLFKYHLSLYMIIYYLILIISSALGGFAANLKKDN